jgi:iron complex transport system permease protein
MAGSVLIPVRDVFSILLGGSAEKASWETIILGFRLPRALTALLAGAALAVSGLQMQTLFRNPLAGPFVLGISAGASLGVALVVLVFGAGASTLLAGLGLAGDLSLAGAAALGSGAVLGLVFLASRRVDTLTLLILGVLFGYGASALVSILLHFSIAERIQLFVAWTFGSFAGVTWEQLAVLAPTVVVGLILAGVAVKGMNALLLGETYAESLGVSVASASSRAA